MDMIDSFQGIQKWDIPTILTGEGHIKGLDKWKQGFQDSINAIFNSLAINSTQNDKYYNIIDKLMEVELMYHRFTLEDALCLPVGKKKK